MSLFKSLLFFVFFCLLTMYFYSILCFERLLFYLRQQSYGSNMAHSLAARWGQCLFRMIPGWQLQVEGKENLPVKGESYVIVANHESATDILAIYLLGLQFRWLAKKEIFSLPLIGTAMGLCDYVPIIRGDSQSHQRALNKCAQLLRHKTPILFFPEGTRSVTGSPKSFKKGAFRLAQQENVSVLPIVLSGAGRLMKKRTLCPNAACIRMKILPLQPSLDGESASDYTIRIEKLMKQHHAQLKTRL